MKNYVIQRKLFPETPMIALNVVFVENKRKKRKQPSKMTNNFKILETLYILAIKETLMISEDHNWPLKEGTYK